MESERFDDLVRVAFERASRRRVVRVSLGALAASLLAERGMTSGSAAKGKKGKKRKKNKDEQPADAIAPSPSSPPAQAKTCPAEAPLICGSGCCPTTFPKCCTERLGAVQPDLRVFERTGLDVSCNPAAFTCCPAELGGGSCGGRVPQCCPPSERNPFGICAAADATCCPVSVGGGACPVELPKCCPGGGAVVKRAQAASSAACCQANEDCCLADEDCPDGHTCNGNCCQAIATPERALSRAVVSPRAGFPAR